MTPHRLLHILTILLALLAAMGCRDRRTAELLARADSVMEADPDSARALLDSIDPSRLRGSDLALYAVLDAQSRHKLNLGAPSDSLLNIAVDRYTAHGPDSLLMKALFYRSITRVDQSSLESAVSDMMESRDIAVTLGNAYWEAKNEEGMADMMRMTMNFQEESLWRIKAVEAYRKAGKIYNELYALCDAASAMMNARDSIGCRSALDSIDIKSADLSSAADLAVYELPTKIFYHANFGLDSNLDSLFRDSTVMELCTEQPALYLAKADLLTRKGRYGESRELLDSLSNLECIQDERSLLQHSYYALAKASGDYELLKTSTDGLLESQLRDIDESTAHPVIIAQRDYLNKKVDYHSERVHRAIKRTLWISISMGCLLLIAITVYQLMLRRKNRIVEEQVERILEISGQLDREELLHETVVKGLESLREENGRLHDTLKETLSVSQEKEEQLAAIQKTLQHTSDELTEMSGKLTKTFSRMPEIYRERWKTLEMLCKQLYKRDGVPDKMILDDIRNNVEKIQSEEFFQTVVRELDRDMDGIASRLYEQCPNMKERDKKLCVLSFAKIGNTTIGLLLDMTDSYVSMKRKRIRDSLAKTDAVDKELFIYLLSNTVK